MNRVRVLLPLLLLAGCSRANGAADGGGAASSASAASAASAAPTPSTGPTGNGGGGGNGGGVKATGNAAPLAVVIAGGAPTSWSPASFAPLPRFTVHADNNDKDAWSLRDVVHALVGPKARVTGAVTGDGDHPKIDAKDWADKSKTPVLRINRRGQYKIEWVDSDGDMTNDDDVRDVRSIEVTPGG